MFVDDEVFDVNPGLAITIMPGEKHQIINNLKKGDLKFLVFSSPAWNSKDMYE